MLTDRKRILSRAVGFRRGTTDKAVAFSEAASKTRQDAAQLPPSSVIQRDAVTLSRKYDQAAENIRTGGFDVNSIPTGTIEATRWLDRDCARLGSTR